MEKQPGMFGAVIGLFGFVFSYIQLIEPWIRVLVMIFTGLAAFAGFLYNIEKWRKERNDRLKKEQNNV